MICATRIHNNESLTPYAPYDGTSVIEERSNSSLLAHYRYAGKLLALSTPQGNQYYHLDALGSTTELTDDQGDIKASYHLDPWGSIEEITGDSINRRIFTGKETDQNTGLINIGVRYYDPETARFITQDSYLGKQDEPPSLHRYLYAYSNPTVYVDLEGYEAQAKVQSTFYPETDWYAPSPVRDTGNQTLDNLWAGTDNILNMGKYVVNAATTALSIPSIGYAKLNGISVQQADKEIAAGLASSGPAAPYLMGVNLPFRVGPVLGNAARAMRVGVIAEKAQLASEALLTKELRDGTGVSFKSFLTNNRGSITPTGVKKVKKAEVDFAREVEQSVLPGSPKGGVSGDVTLNFETEAALRDLQEKLPRVRLSAEKKRTLKSTSSANMKNPHDHHTLEVNGRPGEHRAIVREGQEILRNYDIDPLHGLENLVRAPNKGHTMGAAQELVDELKAAKEYGFSRNDVVEILKRHGEIARGR